MEDSPATEKKSGVLAWLRATLGQELLAWLGSALMALAVWLYGQGKLNAVQEQAQADRDLMRQQSIHARDREADYFNQRLLNMEAPCPRR